MTKSIEIIDQSKLPENAKASNRVSELVAERMAKWEELSSKINSMPNNPEKIFEGLNLPLIFMDDVRAEGNGYKRVYEWNGKQYKRPELVAKAFYEMQGYQVTWSEGVAWNMAMKAVMAHLSVKFSKYFDLKDTRDESMRVAISVAKMEQEMFEIHKLFGPPLHLERAIRNVEGRHNEKMNNLRGVDGKYDVGIRSILQKIYDQDEFELEKSLDVHKLVTNYDIVQLRNKLVEEMEEISNSKDVSAICMYFPKVGDVIFNEYRDKYNLNEWSIKFAKDILENMSLLGIYKRIFEANGSYEAGFDLTAVNYEKNEVKFIEVKVDDKFTEWQINDLINAVYYNIPVELLTIRKA